MGTARRRARVRRGTAQASDQARARSLPPATGDQRAALGCGRPPSTVRGAARGRSPRMAPVMEHAPPVARRVCLHRVPETHRHATDGHRREAGPIRTPEADRIRRHRTAPLHHSGRAKADTPYTAPGAPRRRTMGFRSSASTRRPETPPCSPKGPIPTARPPGPAQPRRLPPQAGRLTVGAGRQTLGDGGRLRVMEAGRSPMTPQVGRPRTTLTARRLDPVTAAGPFCLISAARQPHLAMVARRPRANHRRSARACLVAQMRQAVQAHPAVPMRPAIRVRPAGPVRRVPMPGVQPATRTGTTIGDGGCCSPSWARPPSRGWRSGSPTSSARSPALRPTRVLNPCLTRAPIHRMARATEASRLAARWNPPARPAGTLPPGRPPEAAERGRRPRRRPRMPVAPGDRRVRAGPACVHVG